MARPAITRTRAWPSTCRPTAGMGLTTEEQPAAYRKGLALGVSTLELDTQVTADKKVVVSHDRVIDGTKCRDTGRTTSSGGRSSPLTLAQVQTLDRGFQQYPGSRSKRS